MDRVVAWGLVALVHLLVAWVVTRPFRLEVEADLTMQLVYIQLSALPAKAGTRPINNAPAPRTRVAAKANAPQEVQPVPSTAAGKREAPLQATLADDHWDRPAGTSGVDAIALPPRDLTRRFNPIQPGPPERFPMRTSSPADMVRAVSQALFWPPGYTDDPCPGIKKAMESLRGASTRRERGLLEDAARERDRYCS